MGVIRKVLAKVSPYKGGKPIEEVRRELGLREVYKLASNEIPFMPLYIKKAVDAEINNINRYPEASCFRLRREIAKKFKVKESQVVFGNGSDELITLTLRATIEKGDEVIVAYPTFLIYEIQALAQGAFVRRVGLKNFRYDLEAIKKAVSPKTKVIFIANPDNPTGTYVSHGEVAEFLKGLHKGIVVFFDEAYFEFAPKDFPRTIEFMKKRRNIIFTRTFSKIYGLAGLRIGYAITDQDLSQALNTIREPFNVNRFAQASALAALKNKGFAKKASGYIQKEKIYLYRQLEKLGVDFVKSATNFILVNFKRGTLQLSDYMLRNGVIVRELSGWGFKNFFRVTVGLHKENKKFVQVLRKYLIRLQPHRGVKK